jgi:HprK-related kinase A
VVSGDHWAHHTPSLNGLSYRFAVRTDDERLGRHLDSLLAGLRAPGPVDHWYSVTAAVDGGYDVTRDDEPVALAQHPGDAAGWLVWDVNRLTAEAGGAHLLFHAAGVAAGGTGMVLPGPSGSGKSTLCAGLARAGLSYLSDELVALELDTGRLLPYAKPITIKAGSFAALRALGPPAGSGSGDAEAWAGDEWAGEERLLPVGGAAVAVGRPCEPGFIVVPRYEKGAPTRLAPLSATEAFVALAVNAVNFKAHGTVGTDALGALVARCECVALTMSDLGEACRLVEDLVGRGAAERGAGRAS